jgi:hypothetical protein
MPRISMLKGSVRAATAVVVLVGLLSPANATSRQDTVAIFPDLPTNAVHGHKPPIVLTSSQPWIAPVGHRQPRQADAPQHEAVSEWEHQQQQANQEVDRKLTICRGC